ncbi:MAG: leucine-rich repeat protein [Oscillospiraceae bacterium]|nr:leucine-rich repeat protein [Oscillospiraceae bacterium]
MKRIKFMVCISTALFALSAVPFSAGITAQAATGTGTTSNGLKYSYDTSANKAVITGYTGSASAVTIPSTLANCSVKEIGKKAFFYKNVTSVSLPNTVSTIGENAFYGSHLTSITLPSGVTAVDQYAFAFCSDLQTVTISGAAELDLASFWNCPSLTSVQVSANSKTKRDQIAFMECPNLTQVNGIAPYTTQTDSSGHTYPVLNPAAETAIRNHFSRSTDVKFVNDFCSLYCAYIVDTETDPWMTQTLKARQLHDWLVRHCEYEDKNGIEQNSDTENFVSSAVFLSCAMNVRGNGIGEAVCDGYSKAYNMLLAQAGMECYRIGTATHSWNIAKIDNQFYEIDVTHDDPITYNSSGVVVPDNTFGNIYSTRYTHFLKSHADMKVAHKNKYNNPELCDYNIDHHPLLGEAPDNITALMAQCTVSLADTNQDGMLDNDFDMDGTAFGTDYWEDILAYSMLCGRYFGYDDDLNDHMPEALYIMHQEHHGVWG